jgi:invasion protein IalB
MGGAMRLMSKRIIMACLLAALTALPAMAQDRTVATFGDWSLRCEAGPPRNCETATTLSNQERRPMGQIVLGRLNPQAPVLVMAHLPLNVQLPAGVRLALDGAPIMLQYQRCVPQGCFATIEVDDALMRRLRAEPAGARLVFQDATRREITLAVSMRGFAQAQAALAAQR